MLKFKIVSSLEKAFLDDNIDSFEELSYISVLRGERISLQLLATYAPQEPEMRAVVCDISLSGQLSKYARVRFVRHMPVSKPNEHGYGRSEDGYLRTTPGLYPDMLDTFKYGDRLVLQRVALESVWIDITVPDDCSIVGSSTLNIKVESRDRARLGEVLRVDELKCDIEVINASLPGEVTLLAMPNCCSTTATHKSRPHPIPPKSKYLRECAVGGCHMPRLLEKASDTKQSGSSRSAAIRLRTA